MLFVIDPRPYQAAVDQAKADLDERRGASRLGDEPARAGARRWSTVAARCRRRRSTSGCRSGAPPRPPCSRRTPRCRRRSSISTSPRCTAPISGRVSNRRIDVGNLVTGDPNSTLLTTIVSLDPIYFVFDMSEARFPRLSARRRARRPCRRRATRRRSSQARLPDETDWPHPGTMNFVDNRDRSGLRHDPRARGVPEPRPVHHAGPVRPAARSRLEPLRGDPRSGQRHRRPTSRTAS